MTEIEDRVTKLEYAVFGVNGENGLRGEVRGLRKDFFDWQVKEAARREAENKDRLSGQRAVILALLAAVIALVGTIASLVGSGVLG